MPKWDLQRESQRASLAEQKRQFDVQMDKGYKQALGKIALQEGLRATFGLARTLGTDWAKWELFGGEEAETRKRDEFGEVQRQARLEERVAGGKRAVMGHYAPQITATRAAMPGTEGIPATDIPDTGGAAAEFAEERRRSEELRGQQSIPIGGQAIPLADRHFEREIATSEPSDAPILSDDGHDNSHRIGGEFRAYKKISQRLFCAH